MKIIIICFIFTFPFFTNASTLEFTAAGNYTSFEDSNVTKSGISTRFRYRWGNSTSGWQLAANLHGNSILFGDYVVAYGLRSSGVTFYEIAGGVRAHPVWGTGVVIIFGVGTELSGNWYINLPLYYRLSHSIEITPYIGYRF